MTPVVIVGRGRLGSALARALRARRAGVSTRAGRTLATARVRRPAGRSVLWVLAVRDGALDATARALAPSLRRGDAVLHLAGMLGPEVLAPAREGGASVGSFHPLRAVVTEAVGSDPMAGSAFLFEGDRGALREARALAKCLGGRVIVASSVDRARYHGGAALVATGAVALAQGAALLLASSVRPRPSERALRAAVVSLLESVAINVGRAGPERALASPLLRDDTRTVGRHLDAMASASGAVASLYASAVAVVLDALEATAAVKPETIAEARRLVAAARPELSRRGP